MSDASLEFLREKLHQVYGQEGLVPYGGPDGPHGIAFRLRNVPATFSVITLDGALPFGRYDVQIESYPPGDYVYSDEVDADEFLNLVDRVARADWP